MIKGIGTDLIKIERLAKSLERQGERFAQRILSEQEFKDFKLSAKQANFLSKRFAAKEAVSKALGTGIALGVSWQDIELSHLESGQPIVNLYGGAKQQANKLNAVNIHISLSDEAGFVSAFAVLS